MTNALAVPPDHAARRDVGATVFSRVAAGKHLDATLASARNKRLANLGQMAVCCGRRGYPQ
jgi:hypothetical protein